MAWEIPGRASSGLKLCPGIIFPVEASKVIGIIAVGVRDPNRVNVPSTVPREYG